MNSRQNKPGFNNGKKPSAAGRNQPKSSNNKKKKPKKSIQKAKSNGNGKGRPQHFLSPFFPANIPTLLRTGDAFPYMGVRRLSFTLDTNQRALFAVTNVGLSGTCMALLQLTTVAGVTSVFRQVYTIPTLAADDSSGGPTSARAMKAGLSIVNTTQLLNQGGRVFHCHGVSRLKLPAIPSSLTAAQSGTLMDDIVAFPSTKSLGGHQFVNPREYTCSVVDNTRYEDFDEFSGTLTVDEFWQHIAVWPSPLSTADRPMSTIWIVFDSPPALQTYTLSARAAFYTRWSVDTVQGQSQRPIPTAPASVLNQVHSIANSMAAVSHTINDLGIGALGASIGSAVSSGARLLQGGVTNMENLAMGAAERGGARAMLSLL